MRVLRWIFPALAGMNWALATTVAVIDSGTDLLHKDLSAHAWVNPGEIRRNNRDDDVNGFQDDIHGWNFAENNNKIIDYKYLGTFSQDPYRFFEIQLKMFEGTATEEDKNWLKEKRGEQAFMQELAKFGNFVHGTHVAGIAVRNAEAAKILAVKLIPTEVKLPFSAQFWRELRVEAEFDLRLELLKMGLTALAQQQSQLLQQIGEYVGGHKAAVANGSFGTGITQAKVIITALAKLALGRDATEEELHQLALHFLGVMAKEAEKMTKAAPDTLFVLAAGNDGNDNDIIPTSPANVDVENAITVAATFGRSKLADFSSFGAKTVDVAAPGVGIESAIPGNEWLKVSGTSQAAPYIASLVARIRTINPRLTPAEVKRLVIQTVDKKEFLQGKVKAAGVANPERAVVAAELSKKEALHLAVQNARHQVADLSDDKQEMESDLEAQAVVLPLPTGFSF